MAQNNHTHNPACAAEIWGGLECTVNRVGDQCFDQLIWSGHQTRPEDLDLFAGLGIQAIRYPVVWERTAPDGVGKADWRWPDERLQRLRELGIRPIAGLVHHGNGPRSTSLLDPEFPQKLAGYARAVAERYPWLDAYIPVNEPLTTARFSGLYGLWYPHAHDAGVFLRILLNQVRGVQLSMRAIRAVNPAAILVQTEDIGKVYSSPALRYQAEHENERRWLSFDLLCGRVDRQHPLYGYLRSLKIPQDELEQIQQDAVSPDILGIDYYVTSERFLDDRLDLYPSRLHGGNGYDRYVDIEAVRVCQDTIAGHAGILQETWERYSLPLALTEVHLGGAPHDQLRWLMEAWNTVQNLRRDGVDVRALTAWALLGSFNWNNLVTRDEGHYEPGVFDVRTARPNPTLLAHAVEALARRGSYEHPALEKPGWWHDPARMLYPCVECQQQPIPISLEDAPQNQAVNQRR